MRSPALVFAFVGICLSSPAASLRPDGVAFRPATNAEITWAATNSLPRKLWIYQVMPKAFSGAVVSNAMAIGNFAMRDLAKSGNPQFEDKSLIHFENKNEFGRRRWLDIAPTLGTIKYASARDSSVEVEAVPSSDEAEDLARQVLFQLGVDQSLLAERVRKGYDETSTRIDREGHTLGPERVLSRGVSFERRIDGVALSENWCFLIHFGSHGRIEDFTLRWRNILPAAAHAVLSSEQIVQMIKSNKALLPPQFRDTAFLTGSAKIKITKAEAFYFDGTGKEPLDYMIPYVQLDVTSSGKGEDAAAILDCPIFSDSSLLVGD